MDSFIFFITGLSLGICIYHIFASRGITININHKEVNDPVPTHDMVDMAEVMNNKPNKEDQVYEDMGVTIQHINEEISNIFGGSDRE